MSASGQALRRTGIGVVIVVLGTHSIAAADDDVPPRAPSQLWQIPVNCSPSADLDDAGSQERCNLAYGEGMVYLHEHAGADGDEGASRLTAFDIETGATIWRRDVGSTGELLLADEAIVVVDKSHVEVYDAASGEPRFTRAGRLGDHNDYGVLLMVADDAVTAVDGVDGTELWTEPGALGAMCRDYVALVPARSGPAAPFRVVEQRTGDLRWRSEVDFDPAADDIACAGGPWIYTTDGAAIYEWSAYDGWLDWETAVPNAGAIELYREVALVRSGPLGDNTVAVQREDGDVLWESPASLIGRPISLAGRLRENSTGVFTLHPQTGVIVREIAPASPAADAPRGFVIVGASDTRVVIAVGSEFTAYGMNDLGTSWQVDVGGEPDDFGVSEGFLVVRTGDTLRGYGVAAQAATTP